ncbi:MAG: PepSY-like domain-containing protein [Pedobacter sp.]|uniref:PepSY-like domain-containing protein n=1 Tax=Pedobacter sp. TaxID=1411316 RepID=UPI00356386ED
MKSSIIKIGFFGLVISFIAMNVTAQEKLINRNELPKTAQKFISDYFKDQTPDYIIVDKKYFSTDYKLQFADGTEIEFDGEGNWTEVDGNKNIIPTGYLQKNILNYVNEKFPNAKIIQVEKGKFKQEVKLSNGLELEFTSKGVFKRIED